MNSRLPVAQTAKAALRRLALARLEPTPENYARAYAEEGGESTPILPARARPLLERLVARTVDDGTQREDLLRAFQQGRWDEVARQLDRAADAAAAQGQAWAALLQRAFREVQRGGRQWTRARRQEGLQRLLAGSGSDPARLQQRLRQLLQAWEEDATDAVTDFAELADAVPAGEATQAGFPTLDAGGSEAWRPVVGSLESSVRSALPPGEPRAVELADALAALAERIGVDGATPELVQGVEQVCLQARRLFAHRHRLVDELGRLCGELTLGLTELAEDDSWARGQCEVIQARLGDAVSARAVRAAGDLLTQTRLRQQQLRGERNRARDALKELFHRMLHELGELDEHTGRFDQNVGRHAEAIERAETLESLAGVVREMVEDSRTVRSLVQQAQSRLHDQHQRAGELESRVRELESELRRLSDEVSTDALTQVSNRRGLMQAFDTERARLEREAATPGATLSVGLIDIDNFKALNDRLGHAAGDMALKALAARVRDSLRPVDRVARFGGEEFVVMLPDTPVDEAQQVLTRLQRQLSASLFMHDEREVFVTFSAGVTAYRPGEALDAALERADEAMYEAKRSGKNRTCVG